MPLLLLIIVAAAAAVAMAKKAPPVVPPTPEPDDATAIGGPAKGRTVGSFFVNSKKVSAMDQKVEFKSTAALPSYLPESTKKPPFATPGPGEHGIIRADDLYLYYGGRLLAYYLGSHASYPGTPGPLGTSYNPKVGALAGPIARDIVLLNPHLVEMGRQVQPSVPNDEAAFEAGLDVIREQHHYLVIPRTWQPFMRKEPIGQSNKMVKPSNHYPISVPPVLEFDGAAPGSITMAQLQARLVELRANDSGLLVETPGSAGTSGSVSTV